MKMFIDRITDCFDNDELKPLARQLHNKKVYVASTSGSPTAEGPFLDMFKNTFTYLGMKFNGSLHGDYSNPVSQEELASQVRRLLNKPSLYMSTLATMLEVASR